VFALGATGILNCLDGSDGRLIWTTNILQDANTENALFGMSGSPLVVNDLIIVSPGGKNSSLVAYDRRTGERVWAAGDSGASYSSPQYAPFVDHPQILTFNAEGLFGHDVFSGRVLWHFDWVSNPAEKNNVCQPVVLPGGHGRPCRVFISSGYGKGCVLSDIVQQNGTFNVHVLWRNKNLKAKFSSLVRHGTHIYGLDEKILVCVDLATGRRCWKGGRYGHGQLVLADNTIIIQAESGEVVLVEATSQEHHELARFTALDHRTWNHPTVAGDILLVRNDREATCYQLSPSVQSTARENRRGEPSRRTKERNRRVTTDK
jgi:outer membrane protein assembly factor BamB